MLHTQDTILAAVLVSLGLALSPLAIAQSITAPERGTLLRTELLDAVRPNFVADTNGPIEFVVHRLRVFRNWSFGHVTAQRPGGGKVNWTKTRYAEAFKEGVFDPESSYFLLKRQDSTWNVVDYAVGPTDVVWDGWRQEYKLPNKMFWDE